MLTQQSNGTRQWYGLFQRATLSDTSNLWATGDNLLWDFRGLTDNSGCCGPAVDTTIIDKIANGSGLHALFPTANWYSETRTFDGAQNGQVIFHSTSVMNSTANGNTLFGGLDSIFVHAGGVTSFASNDTSIITPPSLGFFFPFTYGSVATTTYTDTVKTHYGGTDAIQVRTQTDSLWSDAYGTLVLPNKTYTNVLRVARKSLYVSNSGTSTAFSFGYWAPGYPNAVLAISFFPDSSIVSITYLKNPESALPLKLMGFTGELQHNKALLHWKTADNVNTQNFVVERSGAALQFTALGIISAVAGSKTVGYNFADAEPLSGANYYRLKMYDKDGTITYSGIVALNNNSGQFALNMYPNPAGGSTTLRVNTPAQGNYKITLTDMAGKTIKRQNGSVTVGLNVLPFNTQGLAKGIYLVTYEDLGGTHTVKLIKQ